MKTSIFINVLHIFQFLTLSIYLILLFYLLLKHIFFSIFFSSFFFFIKNVFFTGGETTQVINSISGNNENFKSFVIHSDRFTYRFRASTTSNTPGWGYKFTVSPLLGLSWSNDNQVLKEPSLEYACWILDFLLSSTVNEEGDDVMKTINSAVCTPDVFKALANYLRSPGAPYKRRGKMISFFFFVNVLYIELVF